MTSSERDLICSPKQEVSSQVLHVNGGEFMSRPSLQRDFQIKPSKEKEAMTCKLHWAFAGTAGVMLTVMAGIAPAQQFPTKPIRY